MKKAYFKVKVLSDIVLQATSNNEGRIIPLDYIPGSNFLGIVAKHYDDFENSFDIFHSGKVRFGDATIVKNNQLSYKMPYSFYYPKLKSDTLVYNFHLLDNRDFEKLGQLKQKRSGFITKDGNELQVLFRYLQKSAYDKEKRKSKESQMYGYDAIESGKEFGFCIQYEEECEKDFYKIKKYLLGLQRLGKSRSAEYGLVEIEEWQYSNQMAERSSENGNNDILYCKSKLALFDKSGSPTWDVKYIAKNLDIDYEKTQIRVSTFTPFNRVRETKDYERVVIEPGSVIVLKHKLAHEQRKWIEKGVGAYISEGFGEILVNPPFLMSKEVKLEPLKLERMGKEENIHSKDKVLQYLENRKKKEIREVELIERAREFVNNNRRMYGNISKSQWGAIRSLAKNEKTYKEDIIDFVKEGQKKWDIGQIKLLEQILYDRDLILHIAVMMQREKR